MTTLKRDLFKIGAGLLALIAWDSMTYTVHETEQVVLTAFGKPRKIIVGSNVAGEIDSKRLERVVAWDRSQAEHVKEITAGSGLYFKRPFIDTVNIFEDRVLEYDSAPAVVVTKDKKQLIIDNYARWNIDNPLLFMKTVLNENGAQSRLDDMIYSSVREVVGQYDLIEIVRSSNRKMESTEYKNFTKIVRGRDELMEEITRLSNEKAKQYGINIIDVRIKRADLPKENAESVYKRMVAERSRVAKTYRSEGEEESIKIRAETDRDKQIILAEGYKKAEGIRGNGDATALTTYADAYSKDPEFYKLWRTLRGYSEALPEGTRLILDAGSDFFQYLKGPQGKQDSSKPEYPAQFK